MTEHLSSTLQPIFTVGHSALEAEAFLELLTAAGVDTVIDVRSQPVSRLHGQFDRVRLREFLRGHGIRYAFMGDALGGRPADTSFYDADGHVDYGMVASSPSFKLGLEKVMRAGGKYRLALLCAEEDPTRCHRHLLVARALVQQGWPADRIVHLRSRGRAVTESQVFHQLGFDRSGPWKSPQSVLHKVLPNGSSSGSERQTSDDL